MRVRMALLMALAAVAGLTSCETTQPVGSGSKQMSFSMSSTALVDLWNLWDVFVEDANGDLVPASQPFPTRFCDIPTSIACCQVSGVSSTSVRVPWNYVVDIAMIPSGTGTEQTLASSVGDSDPFTSRTPFDSTIFATLGDGSSGGFFFRNGRRVSAGSEDYMANCLGVTAKVPEESVLGFSPSFVVELNKGDTVIIRARKELTTNSEFAGIYLSDPRIISLIEIDGIEINPRGDSSSSTTEGAGFTLSYTLR